MSKVIASRNQREGYYAGKYPKWPWGARAGHKRWTREQMDEFYPRIQWRLNSVRKRKKA